MTEYSIGYNYQNQIISLPDQWKVNTLKIVKPRISLKEIKNAIVNPVNSKRICDLAKKGDTVSIIIEDITRRTPLEEILLSVLEELDIAGIKNEDIVIIGATAAHRMMNKDDFIMKVGEEIFNKIECISHNPYEGNKWIGQTSRGTPVSINERAYHSKIKIGIGGIAPHGFVGFGGGGKLILPGISAYSTIEYNHTRIERPQNMSRYEVERPARHDIEEAARMAGLNFMVAGLIDDELKLVDMVAGHPVAAHRIAAEKARKLYTKDVQHKPDIMIVCAYPLEQDLFQATKALGPIKSMIKEGVVVLWISACVEGLGCHLLVQNNEYYRQRYIDGIQLICNKAKVIFCSHNLKIEEIRAYIPNEVILVDKLKEAINQAEFFSPDFPEVAIFYSGPFSVFAEDKFKY